MKKAFDTVDHQILLKNIIYLNGIRGNILKWLESYLSDRSQYVTYDGMQSNVLPIKCWVPQGSILVPLLFIIYMNDICNVSDLLYTILELRNCKYLVIILDNKISWVEHITYVKNKISKGTGIIYQGRKYLNRNCLISLYNSYIYPYLIYCVESWGNASVYHRDPLFVLQKKL